MRILILEDHPDIATPLVDTLERERYEVVWAKTVDEAHAALAEADVDLAVLDVMLPGSEDAGFDLARTLRRVGFAGHVMFLSARDAVADRVTGLDAGGDDYLVKPFSLSEFLARVRALLRRTSETKQTVLRRGPLTVDLKLRTITWHDQPVALSDREFGIVELLAHYPGKHFSVDELYERFFPDAASGHRVVRVYVRQLRQKTGDDLILTVPGGYRLGPA